MAEAAELPGRTEATFRLPPLACDTHCHVFGPQGRFPFSPGRKYDPTDSPKETLAALHQRLGIERAVLVQASAHGTDNSALLDALAWHPEAWRGVALIDDETSDRELALMHDAGVRGIRFNFVTSLGGYPDPSVFERAIARASELGWHVVLHLRGEDILALGETIEALPLPFVIDHMGRLDPALALDQPPFRELLRLMELEGAWIKLSGAERMCPHPYADALPFARKLVSLRPDRILWGTDFPHPNLAADVDEHDLVQLVPAMAPEQAVQTLMLVENPARLYGFDAVP
ncbi:MAG TPA: amidohydrolase family protein [Croceibacterium sp.]|nr:amidohydrolase family protein [Croceibacterium sp.]